MADAAKKKLVAFTTEQQHVGKLMGFNDDKMTELYGGMNSDTSSDMSASTDISAVTPPADTSSTDASMVAVSPTKDKVDRIKAIIGKEEVDKSVKSDGEKLIARLEEADKIFSDVDKYLSTNEASVAASTDASSASSSATA